MSKRWVILIKHLEEKWKIYLSQKDALLESKKSLKRERVWKDEQRIQLLIKFRERGRKSSN